METKLSIPKKGEITIINIDANRLIKMLNEAHSEEWLTYYQSWIGAILMEGPLRDQIKPELFIHANHELNHALLIKTRMLQLGIIPDSNPSGSMKNPRCQAPTDPYIEAILNQDLNNEQRAIQRYKEIADYTYGKDDVTHQMVKSILREELSHKQDIEKWLTDIKKIKEELKKVSIVNNYSAA